MIIMEDKIRKVKIQQLIRHFNNGWDVGDISRDLSESVEWVNTIILELDLVRMDVPKEQKSTKEPKKYKNRAGYIVIYRKGTYYLEHRLVWMELHGRIPDGMVIVHLNGVKDDNRIENLAMVPRYSRRRSTDYECERRIRELEARIRELEAR